MKTDMKTFFTSACGVMAIGMLSATVGAQTAPPHSAQSPSTPAPLSSDSANRPSDYVVGPQDVLRITVFDEPTMSGTYRVDNDGSFQYPMLGRIVAAGQRLRDIEQLIKMKLEDGYIRNAQVAVEVDQFRSRSIFVVGEVRSPGKYPMT